MPGENNERLIIADADAIIALVSTKDAHHKNATQISQYCADKSLSIIFPITAICEATAVLQKRLNNPEGASRIVAYVNDETFPLQPLTILPSCRHFCFIIRTAQNKILCLMQSWLPLQRNSTLMLFSVLMSGYRKIGLPLTDDLIEQSKAA